MQQAEKAGANAWPLPGFCLMPGPLPDVSTSIHPWVERMLPAKIHLRSDDVAVGPPYTEHRKPTETDNRKGRNNEHDTDYPLRRPCSLQHRHAGRAAYGEPAPVPRAGP